MKTAAPRQKLDARTKAISAAMLRARARETGTKLHYMRNGKLVAEMP